MSIISPDAAIEAMKDFGVDVRPYPFDSRPWYNFTTAGGWNPIGIIHHHTTGTRSLLTPGSDTQKAMLRLLRIGRSDLDGPLCHFAPTFNGAGKKSIVYAIGWDNVNHSGLMARNVYDALRAGAYTGERPGADAVDGNTVTYGIEYLHPGDATPWPDELLDAGHTAAAALCDAHGWDGSQRPGSNCEHREATSRKVDRSWSGWGDGMRAAVARAKPMTQPSEPDGWLRPERVTDSIKLLRAQARAYEARGAVRKADVCREEARHLLAKFPRTS